MRDEARGWMDEFLSRLQVELAACSSQANTADIQRYVQFYLMDKIREGIDVCTRRHIRGINDVMAEYENDLFSTLEGQ